MRTKPSPSAASLLDLSEQKRFCSFKNNKLKAQYLACHSAKKEILSYYLGVEPHKVQIVAEKNTKPKIVSHLYEYDFNLSHSNEMALLAISSKTKVGIDLEYIRAIDNISKLAERFFHPNESRIICSLKSKAAQHYFLSLWTAKEALIKGQGLTLAQSLNKYEVAILNQTLNISVLKDGTPLTNWRLESIYLPCHLATIAYKSANKHLVKLIDWQQHCRTEKTL